MSTMKSLADRLRDKISEPVTPEQEEKEVPTRQDTTEEIQQKEKPNKRKEEIKDTNAKRNLTQKNNSSGTDISDRIKEISFVETKPQKQVKLRIPSSLYSKMHLLANDGVSMQKMMVYALSQLMETDEIKQKLKKILKTLNE